MEGENCVWSRYQHIHELVMQPIYAVINLIGAKDTNSQLSEII